MPGKDWAKGFLELQNHIISSRWCQNVKRCRAAISHEMISEYFNELNESLQDVEPRAIVNYDETNFTDDPGVKKFYAVEAVNTQPELWINQNGLTL